MALLAYLQGKLSGGISEGSSLASVESPKIRLIVLNHPPHLPHLILQPHTLEDAMNSAKQVFDLQEESVIFFTTSVATPSGMKSVALSQASWNALMLNKTAEESDSHMELTVISKDANVALKKRKRQEEAKAEAEAEAQVVELKTREATPGPSLPRRKSSTLILVRLYDMDSRKRRQFRCEMSLPIDKLKRAFANSAGLSPEKLRITGDGFRVNGGTLKAILEEHYEPHETEIELHIHHERVGGKPVIYLFPPTTTQATVHLYLCPSWTFSAIYPLTEIINTKQKEQMITWNVTATPDGTLVHHPSNDKLSYLFWEAHTVAPPHSSPNIDCTASHDSLKCFDPSRPILNATNAILLPFEAFLRHLSSSLDRLTLHTSARNDFITYWLPKFVALRDRKQHILMRFLNQAEYERSAPLEVEPKPDVVTRVFMIFKGVDEGEVGTEKWKEARQLAEKVDWWSVVGVKEEALDKSLFRVLEWGGMEVL